MESLPLDLEERLNLHKNAPAPFDKAAADVVLRTSNQVDLLVFRWILEDASPVFKSLLDPGLPQPPPSSQSKTPNAGPDSERTSRIVVDMAEPSSTLQPILRLYYPAAEPPTLASLDEAVALLAAAQKYEMVFASRLLQTAALPLITTTPLRAYALALTAHLVDTARAAAKAHLAHTLAHEVCPPELEDLSVGAYHRLIAYRAKCSAALRTKCKWPEAKGAPSVLGMSELGEWTWFACRACVKHRGSDWSCRKLYCGCAAPWFQTFWDGLLMALCMTPHQDTLDKLESRLLYRLYEGAGGCSTCKAVVVEQIGMLMIVLKQAVDAVVSEVILSVL